MNNIMNQTTDQLCETLCNITEPLKELACDDDVAAALKRQAEMKEAVIGKRVGAAFADLVPVLFGTQKEKTFSILASITGKTVEEIKTENGMKTIREVVGIFKAP